MGSEWPQRSCTERITPPNKSFGRQMKTMERKWDLKKFYFIVLGYLYKATFRQVYNGLKSHSPHPLLTHSPVPLVSFVSYSFAGFHDSCTHMIACVYIKHGSLRRGNIGDTCLCGICVHAVHAPWVSWEAREENQVLCSVTVSYLSPFRWNLSLPWSWSSSQQANSTASALTLLSWQECPWLTFSWC